MGFRLLQHRFKLGKESSSAVSGTSRMLLHQLSQLQLASEQFGDSSNSSKLFVKPMEASTVQDHQSPRKKFKYMYLYLLQPLNSLKNHRGATALVPVKSAFLDSSNPFFNITY